ncbi:hypothetical protein GUITHDRAFT_117472 [Guillardia theta CCMP2712]|uniref:Uncharacterized protein n=1 Tax=Guillardia theta (strain CCMP2712) TaxID=905079 RepID=L1IJE3_GUITC|nr:hypothetical protein GUITHDRAFT_117472 [Guillardia theta CCMP2712]EKX36363.1 hypothetical protein GUITHDRAFT_117472 [Guillardia theta CCMP2712]|eukprot:XP_005823343.1 hypothetical protein GUITHDRAFT_117472 [Guillardia theta CCMP2712]
MDGFKEKLDFAQFFQNKSGSFGAYKSSSNHPGHESAVSQSEQRHGEADFKAKKRSLCSKLALEIFAERCLKTGYATVESTFIAKKYGVSSKTVRDIWNRRTWAEATKPLWTDEEKESTEELDACKERKRQANKRRKLAHMRQGNDKSGDSHDSEGHEMAEEMHQPDKGEGSVQETCSGSETSTMCEQSSAKESQAEDSSDACNPKGSSSGSPEGSSSPTSSMQSKSTTSSETGRSEQCGAKEPRGTERKGPRGGLMDNGYRSEGSSECSAGSKRRGESQHRGRSRTDEAASEAVWWSLDALQSHNNSRSVQSDKDDGLASMELANLLKHITEQQKQILEQQQQILDKGNTLQMVLDCRISQGGQTLVGSQSNCAVSNCFNGQSGLLQFGEMSGANVVSGGQRAAWEEGVRHRAPVIEGWRHGGHQGQENLMGGAFQRGQPQGQQMGAVNQALLLQLLQGQLSASNASVFPYVKRG